MDAIFRVSFRTSGRGGTGRSRELHPTDRRKKVIRLTPQGDQVCREILDAIAQAELEALSELCEEDQRLLYKLNTKFCRALVNKLTRTAEVR